MIALLWDMFYVTYLCVLQALLQGSIINAYFHFENERTENIQIAVFQSSHFKNGFKKCDKIDKLKAD